MARRGGRAKGQGNIPALEKIRQNRHKLEKLLLDKALGGDVEAIKACIELLDKQDEGDDEGPPEEGEEDTS